MSCWKMGLQHSRSRSQQRFKMSVIFVSMIFSLCVWLCPLSISWTAQPFFFLTNFGMVVYYHEVICHVEKLVHYLQCQGHSEGLYNQNMIISAVSSKLLVCLQPNLIWYLQHHKPECPVEKMGLLWSSSRSQCSKVQNLSECFSG